MCNPGNLDMSHREMQSRLLLILRPISSYIATEYKLANRKIADVYCEIAGARVILEVKTILKTSLIENALRKYGAQCDILIICTPPALEINDTANAYGAWRNNAVNRVGIWHIDWLAVTAARMPRALHSDETGCPGGGSLSASLSAVIGSPACTALKS